MALPAARSELWARPLDHEQPDQERGPAHDHADHEDALEHAFLLLVTGCSPDDLPQTIEAHRDAERCEHRGDHADKSREEAENDAAGRVVEVGADPEPTRGL